MKLLHDMFADKYITFVSILIDNMFSAKLLYDMFAEKIHYIHKLIIYIQFSMDLLGNYYMICLWKKYIIYINL